MTGSISSSPFAIAQREGAIGPLSGIRVLDLSAYIAGPYGCTLLADQGAEVIKVEPPVGDNLRRYPSTLEAESRAFLGVNRSKRGVVLDLKQPDQRAVLMRLVREADVLVHNFRPSVPVRLGIDFDSLHKLNPRLVYCSVTGYGEQGPLKDKAGYDQVLQTMTGMCTMQGKTGGAPEILYGSVVDYYAAALVAAGVSSALYERERSGEGQFVGVSLLRSALTMQSARMIWAEGEPEGVGRDMRSGGVTGIHPTAEGYLYISANTPRFWQALCERIGLPELAADVRYDTVRKRATHAEVLLPQLHAALAARSALAWEALFGEEVPCAAARQVEDMFDHPQVLAEAMITSLPHPLLGSYRGITRPIVFGRTPGPEPFAAPVFDQDTAAVGAMASLSKLSQLRDLSVVVADTGDYEAIKRLKPVDCTTNPTLVKKALDLPVYADLIDSALAWGREQGGEREAVVHAVADRLTVGVGTLLSTLVPGRVSTEVDADQAHDTAATVAKARQFIAMYEAAGVPRSKVLIKIAATWAGVEAARQLQAEGIDCNLTLIFNPTQALACSEAGAFLISPFVGRILDWYVANGQAPASIDEDPGVVFVRGVYAEFKRRGSPTVVMGASFRSTAQIEALAGCDRLTISPDLLEKLDADHGELPRRLVAGAAESVQVTPIDGARFAADLAADPMATEKLASGIDAFAKDLEALRQTIRERL